MSVYPVSFWVVIGILIAGAAWAIQRIKDGSGIPILAVIVTVAAWYVGDAFYNDYEHAYTAWFEPDVLQNAWWEVAWFLLVFYAVVPYVHQWFNGPYLRHQSGVLRLARFGTNDPFLQRQLNVFFNACFITYIVICLVATIRLKSQVLYFFFPFLGYKAEPWGRERIGSGFDYLLTLAFYIQMAVTTIFGVLAAISHSRRTQTLSLLLCAVSWPYFLFDRTRNTILAVVIPAILCFAFLRLRGSIWTKIAVLGVCFLLINGWMAFIIENRSSESIATAFKQKGFNLQEESSVHHLGLNMFEELCWINTFIKMGTYEPNWGARYFAELVNPIPRALWPGKPLIGIDYAIARGQGVRNSGGESDQGNVYATVSTGLIGQGIVNFGGILGPMAAALLMSFWVAVLARQDLQIFKLGRLPLYAIGLILTFNLGRDITLITLYPFVFLGAFLWWWDRHTAHAVVTPRPVQRTAVQARHAVPHNANRPSPRPFRKRFPAMLRRQRLVTRFRPTGRTNLPPAD